MKADREQKRREKQISKCSDSFVRGLCSTIVALAVYIVVPLAIADAFFPMLPSGLNLDGLSDLLDRWLIAGVPLVILAFPSKYYGLGTRKRLVFSILAQAMKMVWFLYVTSFGNLSGLFNYSDGDFSIEADLIINGLVLIFAVLIVLKSIVFCCDYRDNREDAREINYTPETEEDSIRVKGRFS